MDDAANFASDISEQAGACVRHDLHSVARAARAGALGFWDWDVETGSISLSPRYYEILGHRYGDFPHTIDTIRTLIHPEDLDLCQSVAEGVMPASVCADEYDIEHRMRHGARGWIWVRSHGTVIERNAEGDAVRICGTIRDINARRLAQADLLSRPDPADRNDAAPLFHLRLAPDSTILEADDAFAAWRETRLPGRDRGRLADRVLPEDREGLLADLAAISAEHPVRRRVLRIEGRKGRVLILDWLSLHDGAARGGAIRGVGRDMTRERAAQAWLVRYQRELESALDRHSDNIARARNETVVQSRGRLAAEADRDRQRDAIEAVYALATRLDGSLHEVCEEALHVIREHLDIRCITIHLDSGGTLTPFLRQGEGVSADLPLSSPCELCQSLYETIGPGGTTGVLGRDHPAAACPITRQPPRRLGFACIPILGDQNRKVGLLTVLGRDGQGFPAVELQLLEIFAHHIGFEIERERLQDQARSSEQAQLLGQITAGVAHEVRNPLNALSVTLEVLEMTVQEGGDPAEYFGRIRRQIDRLARLMNDLLELRRPVETKRLVRRRTGRMLRSILNTWLEADAEGVDRVALEISPEVEELPVEIDPERMTQMVLNLLENAVQHSPDGAPVHLRARASAANEVCIGVSDSGPGIPADHLRRIFDPFFTTRKGGSGLGLSVVRFIVERHHGRITARNNPNGPGATFEIRLPRAATT